MQVKTTDLTGAALDWAVAKCEGVTFDAADSFLCYREEDGRFRYSSDWSQGGPIIERAHLCAGPHGVGQWVAQLLWDARMQWVGPTPLIAAMRCYVANKLGDVVEVPDELVKG